MIVNMNKIKLKKIFIEFYFWIFVVIISFGSILEIKIMLLGLLIVLVGLLI